MKIRRYSLSCKVHPDVADIVHNTANKYRITSSDLVGKIIEAWVNDKISIKIEYHPVLNFSEAGDFLVNETKNNVGQAAPTEKKEL